MLTLYVHFISPADIKLSSLNSVTCTHTCLLLRSLTNSEHVSNGCYVILIDSEELFQY